MHDDERKAFRRAVQDVRPLDAERRTAAPRPPQPALLARLRRRRAERAANDLIAGAVPGSAGGPDAVSGGLRYRRADLGPAAWSRLRRGRQAIEAEVDLHGLDRRAARAMLQEFLLEAFDHDWRCVRVICGKGRSSGPDGPVLRGLVDGWLRAVPEVLGFAEARPAQGGSGALHVLLGPARARHR